MSPPSPSPPDPLAHTRSLAAHLNALPPHEALRELARLMAIAVAHPKLPAEAFARGFALAQSVEQLGESLRPPPARASRPARARRAA